MVSLIKRLNDYLNQVKNYQNEYDNNKDEVNFDEKTKTIIIQDNYPIDLHGYPNYKGYDYIKIEGLSKEFNEFLCTDILGFIDNNEILQNEFQERYQYFSNLKDDEDYISLEKRLFKIICEIVGIIEHNFDNQEIKNINDVAYFKNTDKTKKYKFKDYIDLIKKEENYYKLGEYEFNYDYYNYSIPNKVLELYQNGFETIFFFKGLNSNSQFVKLRDDFNCKLRELDKLLNYKPINIKFCEFNKLNQYCFYYKKQRTYSEKSTLFSNFQKSKENFSNIINYSITVLEELIIFCKKTNTEPLINKPKKDKLLISSKLLIEINDFKLYKDGGFIHNDKEGKIRRGLIKLLKYCIEKIKSKDSQNKIDLDVLKSFFAKKENKTIAKYINELNTKLMPVLECKLLKSTNRREGIWEINKSAFQVDS